MWLVAGLWAIMWSHTFFVVFYSRHFCHWGKGKGHASPGDILPALTLFLLLCGQVNLKYVWRERWAVMTYHVSNWRNWGAVVLEIFLAFEHQLNTVASVCRFSCLTPSQPNTSDNQKPAQVLTVSQTIVMLLLENHEAATLISFSQSYVTVILRSISILGSQREAGLDIYTGLKRKRLWIHTELWDFYKGKARPSNWEKM
jgi:hypothetical protein